MRLFLQIFGILIASETYLLAAEAGMPQLDPTYWPSQAFWLVLVFVLLYLALSKLFIPKIKNNLDDRDNKIKDDLDEAQKLKEIAEEKLKEYETLIENAKKDVQKIIFESKSKLSNDIQNKKKAFDKEIETEIQNTEKEIENFKKESLASIASISEEITAKIIENISGEPMNQSSIKATIQETIKKNIGEHA